MTTGELQRLLGADALHAAFAEAHERSSEAAWSGLLREVGPRVFALPFLSAAACGRLLEELDRRRRERAQHGEERSGPNSMHEYGATLAELGLEALARELRSLWVAPLAAHLFQDVGGADLDGEHAFLAEYSRGGDEDLGFHVDDSAVTLNLCLGEDFAGSELYFEGLRCDLHRQTWAGPDESFEYLHEPGVAILHAGRHRHGVHPLRRGARRNLILWCQSSRAKAAATSCQPWCGAHRPPQG